MLVCGGWIWEITPFRNLVCCHGATYHHCIDTFPLMSSPYLSQKTDLLGVWTHGFFHLKLNWTIPKDDLHLPGNAPETPPNSRFFELSISSGDVGGESGRAKAKAAKATVKGRWTKLSFAKGWMAGAPRSTRKVGWWKSPYGAMWRGCKSGEFWQSEKLNGIKFGLALNHGNCAHFSFIHLLIFKRGRCQNDAKKQCIFTVGEILKNAESKHPKSLFVTKVHNSNRFGFQVWWIYFGLKSKVCMAAGMPGSYTFDCGVTWFEVPQLRFQEAIRGPSEEVAELIWIHISPFLVEGWQKTSLLNFFTFKYWLTDSQAYGLGFLGPVRRLLAEHLGLKVESLENKVIWEMNVGQAMLMSRFIFRQFPDEITLFHAFLQFSYPWSTPLT